MTTRIFLFFHRLYTSAEDKITLKDHAYRTYISRAWWSIVAGFARAGIFIFSY